MTMQFRLDTVAPDLVQKGAGLAENNRSALARTVATLACERTGALAELSIHLRSIASDVSKLATQKDKDDLAAELNRLDEMYFVTMDESEDGSATEDGIKLFSKARAIASLIYAIDATDLTNFCESIYEAQTALDGLDEIRTLCRDGN